MYETTWQYPSQSTIDPIALDQAEFIFPEEFWVQRPEWIKHLRPVDEGTFVPDPNILGIQPDIAPPSTSWTVIHQRIVLAPAKAVIDPVEPVPDTEPERWWRQTSEPVREILRPVDEGKFVIDPSTIGDQEFVGPEEFWRQTEEPVRQIPRPVDEGIWIIDQHNLGAPEFVGPEQFRAHNPEWIKHLRPLDEGLFVSDNEFVGIESELEWFRQAEEPVREILKSFWEGIFVPNPSILGEQPDVVPPSATWSVIYKIQVQYPSLATMDPMPPTEVVFSDIEHWWRQTEEPIREIPRPVDEGLWVIDLHNLSQPEFVGPEEFKAHNPDWIKHLRLVDEGLFVSDTEMVTFDAEMEWWRQASEPVRQLFRAVDTGLFIIDPHELGSAEFDKLEWFIQHPERIDVVKRLVDEGLFVTDLQTLGDAEFDRLQWFVQRPEWFAHLRPVDTGLWVGDVNPVFIPTEDTSWWRQTEEPVRQLFRAVDTGLFVTDLFRQGDAEFAAMEWLVQRPEWIARLLPVNEGLWVIDLPTVPDIEQWWRQTSEPVRKLPRPVDEGLFVLDPITRGDGEFVGPDEFKASNPDWIAFLRPTNEGLFILQPHIDAAPEPADIEHWWRQTNEPVREIPRPVDTGLFVTDLFRQGDAAFDALEWLVQRPEWIARLLPTDEGLWVVSTHIEQVQQDDIEHWWRQTEEPVRLQPRLVDVGIFVIDPTTLGVPGIIVVIIPEAILEGCVDLDDLVDRQRWIDAVPGSGFIDTIWYIVPSGYIKRSGTGNLWDF